MFKRLVLLAALLLATPAFAMTAASIPTKFSIPWGSSAGGSYIRTIPTASQIGIQNGAASLTDGFPPLTFVPVGSGGVPPFGQDFNGILNEITQWSRWQATGGLPKYDGTFSSQIGGYPAGAVLAGTGAGVVWLNTADNNTTNPDSGGSNWSQIALTNGSTFTGATINTSTIVLQQSGLPTPTTEGQIAWGTTNGRIAIGHNSGTVYIPTGAAPGSLSGLTLSNDSGTPNTSLDFASGVAADSTNSIYITEGSALVKQINNAWAAGTNAGGLFSGSFTNGTYHCFAILNPTTAAVDDGCSTSVTASDRPAGYTYFRRIGSIVVSGGVILGFIQNGNDFFLKSPIGDYNTVNPGTSSVTATLTVPTGITVEALNSIILFGHNAAGVFIYVRPLSATDIVPGSVGGTFPATLTLAINGTDLNAQTEKSTLTNTSGQIAFRLSVSTANVSVGLMTEGWVDARGRT